MANKASTAVLLSFLVGCASEPELVSPQVKVAPDELYSGQPKAVYGTEFPAGTPAEANLRGDIAAAKRDYERALFFYVESLRIEPAQVPTLLKVGAIHRKRGDNDRMLAAYRRVLDLEPQNVAGLEGAGLGLLERRDHSAAQALFERAVELDPGRWRALDGLGVLADLRGEHGAALTRFDAALALRPGQASILNNRGYSRYLAGDLNGAEVDFRNALLSDPSFERGWRNLALVQVRLRRFEEALRAFERIENRAAALNDVGYLAMLEGRYAEAEAYLNGALDASPTFYRIADENLSRVRELRAEAEGKTQK